MALSEGVQATDLGESDLPESKVLDHLGLVAGVYDELEIGDRIDGHICQDFEQREVSIGQAVKAVVLNGLGFVRQSLYLTPQFFETKPTERLIGGKSSRSIYMTIRWVERSTVSTGTGLPSFFEMCRHKRSTSSD